MVFVLTMLVLLALVGLVLIARTHGESQRVGFESNSASERSALGSVIRGVQETLRRDIWGSNPTILSTPLNNAAPVVGGERNEPFDDPGPADRWLASSVPYMRYQLDSTQPGYGKPQEVPTGWPANDPLGRDIEKEVLAWPYVSYVGTDITQPAGSNYFYWPVNSRITPGTPVRYGQSSTLLVDNLANVSLLLTPPPLFGTNSAGLPISLIPGSTTNVTIAQARRVWTSEVSSNPFPGFVARFPYFDTNADGIIDLYDADGDGVPDAPLSFAIPLENKDTNTSRRLYAAVRIVDHASMINVNAAFSLGDGGGNLIFDETQSDLQRRGRRASEVLLDDIAHASDLTTGNYRTGGLVDYRNLGNPANPRQWDSIIRSKLAGGTIANPAFRLYGPTDEASLRHRGLLVPYDRRQDGVATSYDSIDRALEGSLIWTRATDINGNYNNNAQDGRWCRLNADIQSPLDEGFSLPNLAGWRQLLTEDEVTAIRRRLLTTLNHEVATPTGLLLDATGNAILGLPPDSATSRARLITLPNEVAQTPDTSSLMDWPVLRRTTFPDISDNLRIQQIDLNMADPAAPDAAKADFIRHSAAAMYMALAGVSEYQKIKLIDDPTTAEDESLNRTWLAWQFGLNLADYRDQDTVPTTAEWPLGSGRLLFGVEQQPFFTEAYAYLTAGAGSPVPQPSQPPNADDKWFHAVELYVPPYYNIPTSNLYIRSLGTPNNLLLLSSFSGLPATLVGGPTGQYIVLCGVTTNSPSMMNTSSFHQNPGFRIAEDGSGTIELWYAPGGNINAPESYVLDVIGPKYTGGSIQTGGSGQAATAQGRWAMRPTSPPLTEGQNWSFSLRRSTKGWRFTSGWQFFSDQREPAFSQTPGYEESLGLASTPNSLSGASGLDRVVPESIWPARVGINAPPVDGFTSARPNWVFDSPGELSRVLMIGPLNRAPSAQLLPPYGLNLPTSDEKIPATALLASILNNTNSAAITQFYGAGRPDFAGLIPSGPEPWAWRLLNYFTTQSPQYDGIDNDGDTNVDAPADELDGVKLLNRIVGRININTAPAAVLRSIPYMSLLPTSAEYAAGVGASTNPYADYQATPQRFWDLASAIVSKREQRPVPLRLRDPTPGPNQGMRIVAVSQRPTGPFATQTPPGTPTGFRSLGALARLTDQRDTFAGPSPPIPGWTPNDALFRADRFLTAPALAMGSHKRVGADPDLGFADAFSPDYRYRKTGPNEFDATYTSVETDPVPANVEIENAGVRARDIFLARWANLLTTRSDVFTAYIALIDEDGRYVQRTQVTLDRSPCFTEIAGANRPVLPKIVLRSDSSYADDLR